MPKYLITLEIRNAKIEIDGKVVRMNAFKTVRVKAKTFAEAEIKAVTTVQEDERINSIIRNRMDDTPMVYVDSWSRLYPWAHLRTLGGATWYSENAD